MINPEAGIIHFAKFEDSDRLQRFLKFMMDGNPRTGREIIHGADITAVSAAACELRHNGFYMECVKQNRPSIYRLFNVDQARQLSEQLLSKDEPNLEAA